MPEQEPFVAVGDECGWCDQPLGEPAPGCPVPSSHPAGHHKVLCRRKWTDGYPDDLWVSVELDDSDGIAHVVFSSSAAWMSTEQVNEVILYAAECKAIAEQHNAKKPASAPPAKDEEHAHG